MVTVKSSRDTDRRILYSTRGQYESPPGTKFIALVVVLSDPPDAKLPVSADAYSSTCIFHRTIQRTLEIAIVLNVFGKALWLMRL